MKSKKGMLDFLSDHFRYCTGNSWNGSTSYAANVKLNRGNWIPRGLMDRAYALLDMQEVYDVIADEIREWTAGQGGRYTAAFNGRSSGYIVLYRSEYQPLPHKSRCADCGQDCFKTAEEAKACGRCGAAALQDYPLTARRLVTWPYCSIDIPESGAGMDEIREAYKLVRSFDALVKRCQEVFLDYARRFEVVDEEVLTAKKVKVLREIA